MNRQGHLSTWLGAALGSICAVLALALTAHAYDRRDFTEEFHQTYALAADGQIELDNLNGAVHISAWDRNEIKVDAVKYAGTKERLEEAQIEIESGKDYFSIRTRYPDHDQTFNGNDRGNPAGVDYTLTVPRGVRLDEIKLINGALDISGVAGEVHASSINGKVVARNLSGRSELSTVNGRLEAQFDALPESWVELNSVNGSVELTIPSDSKAEIEAGTVSGGIDNDFGLRVNHDHFSHDLHGELGNGGTHIKLGNVNGRIEIRRASDGRPLSPVKDLSRRDHDNDDDSEI